MDTDLLLGRLKTILLLSDDMSNAHTATGGITHPSAFRVVIMSATLDANLFQEFFSVRGVAASLVQVPILKHLSTLSAFILPSYNDLIGAWTYLPRGGDLQASTAISTIGTADR